MLNFNFVTITIQYHRAMEFLITLNQLIRPSCTLDNTIPDYCRKIRVEP